MADKYVKLNDIIDALENEWGYEGMREDLEKLPTADVVEVVRCKDCIHWGGVIQGFVCRKLRICMGADRFCSFGYRKPT